MRILVTGGAGYIGSHTIVELLAAGHTPIIVDNFSNSERSVLDSLAKLTGEDITCHEFDIRDTKHLIDLMNSENIEGVIHFAALKAVGESVEKPLEYYDNNIGGLLSVLRAMKEAGVKNLIFSSSCTVYGDPEKLPLTEDSPLQDATNPYGATKQMGERIISEVCASSDIKAVLLRYFNPIGAHPSSLIGELPIGRPNCLVPYLTQATAGVRDPLQVHGDDYPTRDGSGVRDYIHVVDLAKAHVRAAEYIEHMKANTDVFNIGTGNGTSVLELINTFETVNDVKVPYEIGPRRAGDIAENYAGTDKAHENLGWSAEQSLEDALRDAWNWQKTLK